MTAADTQYEHRWDEILGKDEELQIRATENTEGFAACGCGRSPSGVCNGYHALTDEQWSAKLQELNKTIESDE